MRTEAKELGDQGHVRRRKVYYVSGFDPRGAAFYHRLYREEAARQSVHHGDARVDVGARTRKGPHVSGWDVAGRWGDHDVATEYRFLHWDDLVRSQWEPNLLRLLWSALGSYAGYARCGAFGRLRRGFRGPFYSALYPVAYVALVVLLGLGAGAAVLALLGGALHPLGATAAALAIGGSAIWSGMSLGNRLAVFWLLRTYHCVHGWGIREQPELDRRIDELAAWMREDLRRSPADEVLLIGHSVGSIVATSLAARLLDELEPEQRRRVTLVTLGQCIPLLGLIPTAESFRESLRRLGQEREMQWFDMNARADSLCFAQVNPLEISGISCKPGRPLRLVVRPFRMFGKREYARMKLSKQRLHFQYLMASALPNEYDYFRMTAGPSRIHPF